MHKVALWLPPWPLQVIDRTRESYKSALGPVDHHVYSSNGGGKGGARGSNVHSFHDLDSGEAPPMTRDKFLAKLPVSVIKYVCVCVCIWSAWCNAGRRDR